MKTCDNCGSMLLPATPCRKCAAQASRAAEIRAAIPLDPQLKWERHDTQGHERWKLFWGGIEVAMFIAEKPGPAWFLEASPQGRAPRIACTRTRPETLNDRLTVLLGYPVPELVRST